MSVYPAFFRVRNCAWNFLHSLGINPGNLSPTYRPSRNEARKLFFKPVTPFFLHDYFIPPSLHQNETELWKSFFSFSLLKILNFLIFKKLFFLKLFSSLSAARSERHCLFFRREDCKRHETDTGWFNLDPAPAKWSLLRNLSAIGRHQGGPWNFLTQPRFEAPGGRSLDREHHRPLENPRLIFVVASSFRWRSTETRV